MKRALRIVRTPKRAVLAFGPAELLEIVAEPTAEARFRVPIFEDAEVRSPSRLLRPGGERRGEEAAGRRADEHSPGDHQGLFARQREGKG